jgi:hydroxysqualene synthase
MNHTGETDRVIAANNDDGIGLRRSANRDDALASDYAYCARLAREHYENFPVASWLLPAAMRPHIAAIYAFARTADDFADEPGMATEERLRRLDDWNARLLVAAATPDRVPAGDVVFRALANTIEQCQLPVNLFEDLLSAFRQDVTKTRYATWSDVLDYCRRSANPVGRLVLRVAGYQDARLDESSDAFCTALQLTNFWQDLERDWRIGRLYVPQESLDSAGARTFDLDARSWTREWRAVMQEMVTRTRDLFARGRDVCDGVGGRLRWELRVTWLGGSRILDKVARADGDVFTHRPTVGKADVPLLLRDALLWR